MPAPDLIPQKPGEPLATITPLAGAVSQSTTSTTEQDTANAQAPKPALYVAKHNGGGRWIVYDANAPQVDGKDVKVGDFTGTKDEALAEADRLTAGGEPLVLDPERVSEPEARPQPEASNVDATALKQPVMTADGWLCPEPKAKD